MTPTTVTDVPKRKRARAKALSADREARGKRFREAREAAGLGQEDAAAALGTSQTTLWRWENRGTVISGDLLDKAAKLYNKSASWLMRGIEEGSSERPDPPALREFLAGDFPETPLLKDWMIEQMRRTDFSEGGEPTVDTYQRMVMSYITVKPKKGGASGQP